jgi:two-component system, cell cycle response regulator DivK
VIDEELAYDFSDKILLLVEDEHYNSELIKIFLEDTGITIREAKLGHEAIRVAVNTDVDLILMDIGLPDMDGYEVTRQIKKQKPEVIIIAQTAFAASEDRVKAMVAGCTDYISKPIKQALLLSKIKQYLHKPDTL